MAVTTWCSIPQDLYLSTKFVGTLTLYFQTNIFFTKSLSTVSTEQCRHSDVICFGFALSIEPQFFERPRQQYRRHNKMNKSVFPDIYFFFTQPRVYTRVHTHSHREFKILPSWCPDEGFKLWPFCSTYTTWTHCAPSDYALRTQPQPHSHNGHTPSVGPRRTAGFEL